MATPLPTTRKSRPSNGNATECQSPTAGHLCCRRTRIVLAFRSYGEQGRCEVGRWCQQFERLDERHRDLLPSFSEKCRRAVAGLETNQFFLNAMLTSLRPELEASGLIVGDISEDMRSPPQDVEKVRYVLKNLVRDWTREGMEERRATYTPIVNELTEQFSK